jgi:hypothetical protein
MAAESLSILRRNRHLLVAGSLGTDSVARSDPTAAGELLDVPRTWCNAHATPADSQRTRLVAGGANMPAMAKRNAHVSEAIRWCGLSVAWAAIVGISAIVAGFSARAVALVADSIPAGCASGMLVWRFSGERSAEHDLVRLERRARKGRRRGPDPDRGVRHRNRDRRGHPPCRARTLLGRPRADRCLCPGTAGPRAREAP